MLIGPGMGTALQVTLPAASTVRKFRYCEYASSSSASSGPHVAGERSWGRCAKVVSNCRAASICAAWSRVTMSRTRIASCLTLAIAALRSSNCPYSTSANHGTSTSRTSPSSRTRRLI